MGTPAEIREWIRDAAARGADGLKIIAVDRDQLAAILDEAHRLSAAHHRAHRRSRRRRRATTSSSASARSSTSTASPTRRIDGAQHFRPDMNYNDEVHRFARAGELYAQADRAKLSEFVDLMVERSVGWSPTFSIYEASRDVVRAQNLPWFKEYLHPSLEAFFRPSRDNHGSYFLGWTSAQEAQWKEQFRIWMERRP